ncbi:MAG: beta strand repeat-containing protein, partial [Halobacteriaceae archaeon]
MSGNTREQLRAVFFAFVMVTSIMIAGVAFTGTAAAASNDVKQNLQGENTVDTENLGWNVHPNVTVSGSSDTNTNLTVRLVDVNTTVTGSAKTRQNLTFTLPSGFTVGTNLGSAKINNSNNINSTKVVERNPQQVSVMFQPSSQYGSGTADHEVTLSDLDVNNDGTPSGTISASLESNATADTKGQTFDGAGSVSSTSIGSISTDSNGAAPTYTDVRKTGTKEVTVKLSEGVYADEDQLGAISSSNGVSYIDGNSGGATSISSVSYQIGSNSFKITTNNALSSGDIGTDAIFAPGIFDAAGNQLTTDSQPIASETLAGEDNGKVATEIENDAGAADHSQNISAGSATQTLNLITIRDISATGNQLGTRTILTMPDGVNINKTASNKNNYLVSGYNIAGYKIMDSNTLRINHSSSSNSGDQINIKGLVVDTTADVSASPGGTRLDINVDYALGSLDSGLVTVHKPGIVENSGATQVGASTTQNGVGTITISTPAAADQIGPNAGMDELVVYANKSNGITWDLSTDPTKQSIYSSPTKIDHLNASFASDNKLVIPVNTTFNGGDTLSLSSPLSINASGTAQDSTFTAEVKAANSTGVVSAETLDASGQAVTIQRPTFDWRNKNDKLTVGRDSSTLSSSSPYFKITLTADNQLAAGQNVTITTNNSKVTFDRSLQGSVTASVTDGPGGASIRDGGTVKITANKLTFELTGSNLKNNDDIEIQGTSPAVNISSDAVETDVGFNLTTSPGADREDVVSTETDNDPLNLERPNVDINGGNNFTVLTGDTTNISTELGGSATDDEITYDEDSNKSDLVEGADNNITFSLERGSGITFTQTQSNIGSSTNGNLNSLGNGLAYTDGVVLVDEHRINVTIKNDEIDPDQKEAFNLKGITINATSDATNATIYAENNVTGVNETAGHIVVAEENRTTARYNDGTDQVLTLDDTARGSSYAQTGVGGKKLVTVFGIADDIPKFANITYEVSGTGVTFDQSSGSAVNVNSQNVGAGNTDAVVVDGNTLNVSIENNAPASDRDTGDTVQTTAVNFNATESASNTTITFSLNNSSSVINQKDVIGKVNFTEVAPTDIAPDGNDDGTTGDATANVVVNNEERVAVKVTSSEQSHGAFSGADVNLASNDTSIGGTNVSQVTTYENGFAVFNVTSGSTAGEQFNVTATLASNSSISTNLTVTTTAAKANQIDVERLQNGIIQNTDGTLASTEMAAVTLRVEDSSGNVVSASPPSIDIDSLGTNVSANITGYAQGLGGDGVLDNSDIDSQQVAGQTGITPTNGKLYIGLTRTSGTQDVKVSITTPNLGSASGLTTVYNEPTSVSVALANKSSPLTANQNVNVSFTPSDDNGEVIKVQGQSFSVTSTNNTVVASQDGSASTTANGVAYETFDVKQKGSATIKGTEGRTNVFGSVDVTVQGATLSLTLNTSQVTAEQASDVTANVTFAGNGTAAAATVDVTGQDITNQTGLTTGSDGEVVFTVNASGTGNITVTADRSDAASDSATITVEEAATASASVTFD